MKADRDDLMKMLDAARRRRRPSTRPGCRIVRRTLRRGSNRRAHRVREDRTRTASAALRGLTMLGMFSNPSYGGNFEKSGWKMLGFVDQFAWTPPFGYYDRV